MDAFVARMYLGVNFAKRVSLLHRVTNPLVPGFDGAGDVGRHVNVE